MEDEKQIEKGVEQDRGKEENTCNIEEIENEDKVIHVIEANVVQEDATERREKEKFTVEVKGKVHSSSKLKESSKQNLKGKVTVPRPFSLATDQRRLSRERRGSMDIKDLKPTLTRSVSLNQKTMSQPSIGAERSSDLRQAKSVKTATKTSLPPKVIASRPGDTKVENDQKANNIARGKETKQKKQIGSGEAESKKIRKSTTFKALSLPSFYQKMDPPSRPEIKKIPGKDAKSNLLGQESKHGPNTGDKGKTSLRSVSSAKGTISKLFKTTPKNQNNADEKMKVTVVSNARR